MLFDIEYYGLLVDTLFCLVDKPLEMNLGDACENRYWPKHFQPMWICVLPSPFEAKYIWSFSFINHIYINLIAL